MKNFLEKNITFKNLFIGVLILIILFMKMCECETIIKAGKGVSDTVTITTSDTVWADSIVYKFLPSVAPKPKDSIIVHNVVDMGACQYYRFYSDSLTDSNVTIFYKDSVQGWLKWQEISYRLKVPLKITNTITTTIKTQPKFALFVGGEVGGSQQSFMLSPMLVVRKDGTLVHYSYDILNKTHSVGVNVQIFKSKR